MTDKEKLDKLVAEIERLYHQSLVDENRQEEWGLSSAACTSYGKSKVCKELLSLINSMQKEPKECMYSKDNYTDEDRKVLCDGCEEECKYVPPVFDEGYWERLGEKPVSEDLKEAAEEWDGSLYRSDTFIGGAKWQERKDKKWLADNHKRIFNNGYEEGFEAGRDDMEEQLMANAVDGFVIEDIEEGNGDFLLSAEYLSKDMGLKDRQKVKVIVIKED